LFIFGTSKTQKKKARYICTAALRRNPKSYNKTTSKAKTNTWSAKSLILTSSHSATCLGTILHWSKKDKRKLAKGVLHEREEYYKNGAKGLFSYDNYTAWKIVTAYV